MRNKIVAIFLMITLLLTNGGLAYAKPDEEKDRGKSAEAQSSTPASTSPSGSSSGSSSGGTTSGSTDSGSTGSGGTAPTPAPTSAPANTTNPGQSKKATSPTTAPAGTTSTTSTSSTGQVGGASTTSTQRGNSSNFQQQTTNGSQSFQQVPTQQPTLAPTVAPVRPQPTAVPEQTSAPVAAIQEALNTVSEVPAVASALRATRRILDAPINFLNRENPQRFYGEQLLSRESTLNLIALSLLMVGAGILLLKPIALPRLIRPTTRRSYA